MSAMARQIITVIGVNHKTCPLEIREKLSFSETECSNYLTFLKEDDSFGGLILLSTCNRTEFYFLSPDSESGKNTLLNYISEKKLISPEKFLPHLYSMKNFEAIEHLFSVASGIDSLIIGEGQILGQTKHALELSQNVSACDPILTHLFRSALTCGKRARTETGICTGASSISAAAVEFAKMIFGNLEGRTVTLIGAGKMGQITAKLLAQQKLKQVIVANKTYEKALEMAELFGGEAIRFDRLDEYLAKTDIVISSTSAPHCILHYNQMQKVMRARKNRLLFLIDIAVPRDIEPEINKIPNVFLYDIDDLKKVVEERLEERKEEITKVNNIIKEEIANFVSWWNARDVAPLIKNLKQKAEDIRFEEMDKALAKLSHLSSEETDVIEQATKRIINKFLHSTIIKLKEFSSNGKSSMTVKEMVTELFDLEKIGENNGKN